MSFEDVTARLPLADVWLARTRDRVLRYWRAVNEGAPSHVQRPPRGTTDAVMRVDRGVWDFCRLGSPCDTPDALLLFTVSCSSGISVGTKSSGSAGADGSDGCDGGDPTARATSDTSAPCAATSTQMPMVTAARAGELFIEKGWRQAPDFPLLRDIHLWAALACQPFPFASWCSIKFVAFKWSILPPAKADAEGAHPGSVHIMCHWGNDSMPSSLYNLFSRQQRALTHLSFPAEFAAVCSGRLLGNMEALSEEGVLYLPSLPTFGSQQNASEAERFLSIGTSVSLCQVYLLCQPRGC